MSGAQIYYPPGGGGGTGGADGGNIISAGTQEAASTGTVKFANSNGLTFGMSNQSQVTGSYTVPSVAGLLSNINLSAGSTSQNLSKVTFNDSNGVSFGLNGSAITATVKTDYQTSGAYLTTARASNDAIGLNTAGTNITATINSSGFSLNAGGYAGTTSGSQSTAGSDIVFTHNTAGLNLGVPKYLTTAQPTGAYLTTARASTDAVGLNTAKTNVTWTVNSSGISLDAGGYLTTAAASNHSHGNPTLALTNITGTTASASNGLTLSLSGNAAQTVQTQNVHNVSLSGNTAGVMAQISSGVMTLAGGNNVTLSQNGNAVTISGGAAGGADGVNALVVNGGASTASTTLALSNSNNVTFGHNAGTITASASFPAQTNQTLGLYGSGNTSGTSTGTVDARSLTFNVSGSITVDMTNGKVNLSAPNAITTAMASNRGTDFVQANAAFAGTNASGTIASNGISVSVAAPGSGAALKGSGAQTQNTGTVEFANSNGLTFGLSNNGTMTASHNGLTTARASNDGIGLNTAQTNVTWTVNSSGLSLNAGGYAGTNTATTGGLSVTLNTSGISLNAPAWLTTAAQSSASNISGVIVGTASNAATNQTAQLSGAVSFANGSGVSFFSTVSGATSGIAASVKTDYQTAGAYLTTARASNDAVGLNTAQTNVTWTVNSSGISLNAGAYLTTAMASNAATISNINFSAGTTSLNLSKLTFADSNGISFGLSGNSVVTGTVKTDYQSSNANYLTSQSNQAFSAQGGSSAFQTLVFTNSNGISFSNTNGSIWGSHNALTTARASTDAIGLATAKTNVTWTANSAGLSLDAGGYAGTGTSATNASLTLNSNGLAISVGAGGGVTPVVSNSAGSFSFTTLNFSNANNVTWGTSAGSIVTASVAAPGAAAENNAINLLGANTAGNTTATGSTIGMSGVNLTLSGTNASQVVFSAPAVSSLSATGGVSISTNGSTISIGAQNAATVSRFEYPEGLFTSLGQTGQGSLSINHFYVPFNVTGSAVKIGASISAGTNTSATTGSVNNSLWMGIYTLNGSTLSLASSASANNGFQFSVGASSTGNSSVNSMRQLTVPMNVNMTPGEYWMAAVISQQTTYTSVSFNMYGNDRIASAGTNAVLTPIGSNTTANRDVMLMQGIYTAVTSAGPSSMSGGHINNSSASNVQKANYYFAVYNATY